MVNVGFYGMTVHDILVAFESLSKDLYISKLMYILIHVTKILNVLKI